MTIQEEKLVKSLTKNIKITVLRERLEQIEEFCLFKNISQDLCFDEAIKILLKKDKEWQNHKKQQKKLKKLNK